MSALRTSALLVTTALAMALVGGCDTGSGGRGGGADAGLAGDMTSADTASPLDGSAEAGGETGPAEPMAWCEGETRFLYDPVGGAELGAFPDDWYTVDADTPTGVRVRLDAGVAPWLAKVPGNFGKIYEQLGTLDGFGTQAGILLRFTGKVGAVPSGVETAASPGLRLLALDGSGDQVAVEVQVSEQGKALILWPMVPLRPKTRYGVVLSTEIPDASGGCIAPSAALRSLLDGSAEDPTLRRLFPRYRELLEAAALKPGQVSAAVVFTTQDITRTSLAVAAGIRSRSYAWKTAPGCVQLSQYAQCTRSFEAKNYRRAGVVTEPAPQGSYEILVRFWIPAGEGGPWPTVIFGHGLNGSSHGGGNLAQILAPEGIAVVAIDAPGHGAHPTAPTETDPLAMLRFFGVDLQAVTMDALVLRDNFRQGTYDKLQLVELLAQHSDLDGDGQADVDIDRLGYFGVSLGGIMGPELLALDDRVRAAVLSVAGARLVTVITEGDSLGSVKTLIRNAVGGQAALDRLVTVVQAILDGSDAGAWAPYVTGSRLPGTGLRVPQVLQQMAIDDGTVPNVSNRALARALGLTQAPPVFQPVPPLAVAEAMPLQGNIAGSTATAGLFQFDRAAPPEGPPEPSTHNNIPYSPQATFQTRAFFRSWVDVGVAKIVDPYRALGTPPLAAP